MKSKLYFYLLFTLFGLILNILPKGKLHFINTGSSDCILIESEDHFGLIDTSNAFIGDIEEVEKVVIDESKGEKDQGTTNPDESVKSSINYLEYLNITNLDFILSTHNHNDHLGGIPAIAYKFVSERTKYYYKNYRKSRDDIEVKEYANKAYYTAAFKSMVIKHAEMIDLSDQIIDFDFGNIHIKFFNTDIDPNDINLYENDNSIVTLITYKNKKFLLPADLTTTDDKKVKEITGKVDILKLPHHGYSESSYDFIKTVFPDYTIITNSYLYEHGQMVGSFLQQIQNCKVYITGNIPTTTQDIKNSAIRVTLFDENETNAKYIIENTGEEIGPFKETKWFNWYDYKIYFKEGSIVKKWNKIELEGKEETFYFNEDGIMLTGWQKLEWTQGINTFYFLSNGPMVHDTCIEIEGKKYCFDENGCLIE